jgi:hypothetical protein
LLKLKTNYYNVFLVLLEQNGRVCKHKLEFSFSSCSRKARFFAIFLPPSSINYFSAFFSFELVSVAGEERQKRSLQLQACLSKSFFAGLE